MLKANSDRNCYVYRHIRLDKNQVFYVGIGAKSRPDEGYLRSKKTNGRNPLWKKIVAKTAYIIEIVIDGLTWQEACIKEKEFILIYGRITLGTGTLSNLTDGGGGILGLKMSDSTKDKMRAKKKGFPLAPEHRAKVIKNLTRNLSEEARMRQKAALKGNKNGVGHKVTPDNLRKMSRLGIPHTEESRRKISIAQKGRIKKSKGIVVALKNGQEIGRYRTVYEAADALDCFQQNISKVINDHRSETAGYKFIRICI